MSKEIDWLCIHSVGLRKLIQTLMFEDLYRLCAEDFEAQVGRG